MGSYCAASARSRSELHLDDRLAAVRQGRRPALADLSGRAGGLLPIEVDFEVACCKAQALLDLPMVVAAGRANEFDAMALSSVDQELGIDEAGVGDVRGRQELPLGQRRVDLAGHRVVCTSVMRLGVAS